MRVYVRANMCRSRYARASYGDVFGASVRVLELSISARLDSAPSTPTTAVHILAQEGGRQSRCFPCVDESDEATGRERGHPLKFI